MIKKITSVLIATFLFISCTNKSKTTEMKTTENEKLVTTYFEHFNKHEWKKMAEMYTQTADFKDPTLGNGIIKQTQKQIIEKYSGLEAVFPDLKDEVIATYPSGENHIVVEFVSSGTAPDGSKFELPICTIFTIQNGKIIKDFTYFDNFEE